MEDNWKQTNTASFDFTNIGEVHIITYECWFLAVK